MKTALTTAGSNSGGGAGIQADRKTITSKDVYAMNAIPARTTTVVAGILKSTPEFLARQPGGVIFPDAIRSGMEESACLSWVIGGKRKRDPAKNLVGIPVRTATSGSRLITENPAERNMACTSGVLSARPDLDTGSGPRNCVFAIEEVIGA